MREPSGQNGPRPLPPARFHTIGLVLLLAALAVLVLRGGPRRAWATLLAVLVGACLVLAIDVYRRSRPTGPRRRA